MLILVPDLNVARTNARDRCALLVLVDAFLGQHTNALDRAVRGEAPCSTSREVQSNTHLGGTPVRACAQRFALGSAGQLGRPLTP